MTPIDVLVVACQELDRVMSEACDWPESEDDLVKLHSAVTNIRFALNEVTNEK